MNVDRSIRGLAIGAAMLAVQFALPVGAATADTPQRSSFDEDFAPAVYNDICPFPVTVSSHQTGFTIVSDSKVLTHYTEQDAFSANGHTLTGLPYTGQLYLYLAQSHSQYAGVVEKVRLNNGEMFVGAGRIDWWNIPHGDWVLEADFGSSPDIAEFCAELAP